MDSKDIARVLKDVGRMLDVQGENAFKVRAYATGARAILEMKHDLAALARQGKLGQVRGIGKALTEKITELLETGRLELHQRLLSEIPEGVREMSSIRGLGPAKVRALWKELGITTLSQLEEACRDGRVSALSGFGEKTQARVLGGIEELRRYRGYVLLPTARGAARSLAEALCLVPGVGHAHVAGEVRRCVEIAREVVVVLGTDDFAGVSTAVANMPGVKEAQPRSEDRLSCRLDSGLDARILFAPENRFGIALLQATGSPEHLAQLTEHARSRGQCFPGDFSGANEAAKEEAQVYAAMGLPFIPAALREGRGEIAQARDGALPAPVKREDLRGLLHFHTTASDGHDTLEEMIRAAKEEGYEYAGVADHSRSAAYAGGLSIDEVRGQFAEIDAVRRAVPGIRVLRGIESDILADGALDYPDDLLAEFDFVIASVHSRFSMSREDMTARILTAMRHPRCTILGHPTGRLLLQREGYNVDMDAVIAEAARTSTILELNANPRRLDVDWRLGARIREAGVRVAINPDAHCAADLSWASLGVDMACKAGLDPARVINTQPPETWLPGAAGS